MHFVVSVCVCFTFYILMTLFLSVCLHKGCVLATTCLSFDVEVEFQMFFTPHIPISLNLKRLKSACSSSGKLTPHETNKFFIFSCILVNSVTQILHRQFYNLLLYALNYIVLYLTDYLLLPEICTDSNMSFV